MVDTRYLVGRFHLNAKVNSKMRLTLCGVVEVSEQLTDPTQTHMRANITYTILKVMHLRATHTMFAIQNILQKYCSMSFFKPFLHVTAL